MNQFTASNGVRIEAAGNDAAYDLWNIGGNEGVPFTSDEWQALREFFRAQEDERLGRWRWPENPEYVVYHARNVNGDRKVLNEKDGKGTLWGRDMCPAPRPSDTVECAARAYFDAHPEPKPWHDAKPGEVWIIDHDGDGEFPYLVTDKFGKPTFTYLGGLTNFSRDDRRITAGRRIYPEVTE